jgi:chitodextrinase
MNGRSDTGEMFTQTDFQNVLNYATGHGLTRYTFWAVNRDRQCTPPDNNGTTSGTCSSVAQAAWDFTKFTTQFAGATPPTTPPTVPPTTPPPGACTAPAWTATAIFTGGQKASENGHQYTAKWWTQGDDPATHHGTDDVWIDNGTCTGGGTTPPPTSAPPTTPPPTTAPPTTAPPTTPPPTGTQAWVANHAYTVGTLVTYAGHTYKCLQSHTSQVGWEPPNVPALWQLVS